jgi:hypothetical protein
VTEIKVFDRFAEFNEVIFGLKKLMNLSQKKE